MNIISLLRFLNEGVSSVNLEYINKLYGPLKLFAFLQSNPPPVPLPPKSIELPSAWWIVGFVIGEGSFTYGKVSRISEGHSQPKIFYNLVFYVNQLKKDSYLLVSRANFLGHGTVYIYDNRLTAELRITNLKPLLHLILPFFSKYPFIGHKSLQFNIWKDVLLLSIAYPDYSKVREEKLTKLITELSNL